MSDARIKITSNPYARSLTFDRWDEGWHTIDFSTDPTSGLIQADVLNGFLPFKAKQIVDIILDEYGDGTTIVFEGPSDEYEDLRSICFETSDTGVLHLVYGDRELANADDILPKIINEFSEVKPLVDNAINDEAAIESDMDKFIDVAKARIPICVIGNYSAGKSSFINALIGYEILPTGTETVTAKVFQIQASSDESVASVCFGKDDNRFELFYGPDGFRLDESVGDTTFLEALRTYIANNCDKTDLITQLSFSLQFLNEYKPKAESDKTYIPNLIEVSVPFNPIDSWAHGHNFVIFDTPGSNSATDADHSRVLKEQMEGLSDGLIVYLAKADTLSTRDNDELCDFARSIDAMDDRFTMVVVNRADEGNYPLSGFDSERERRILDEAVCKRLEPQGVFYTSSLIALGAKTNGAFRDAGTVSIYERWISKFTDRHLLDYTELYRCNIMPMHKKKQSITASTNCTNKLLANSGLYCIEREIELFADRYSAYNKCHQAEMLLRRIIDATVTVLDGERKQLKIERAASEKKLEIDKTEITQALGSCRRHEEKLALDDYNEQVLKKLSCIQWSTTIERLEAKELVFSEVNSKEHDLETVQKSEKATLKEARENFVSRIMEVGRRKSAESLRDAFEGTFDDVGKVRSSVTKLNATQRDVDRQTANQMLRSVRDSYSKSFEGMMSDIEVRSKGFWKTRSETIREALYKAATGSSALSEDKRQEIGDIIIRFQPLSLANNAETIFVKSELDETLRLLDVVIFESERLNLRKVLRTYNEGITAAFELAKSEVNRGHTESFFAWLDNLMAEINRNIESYNPVLEEQVESIRSKNEQIVEHEKTLAGLSDHLETITQLIGWRERG